MAYTFDLLPPRDAEHEDFPEWNTDKTDDADEDGFYRHELYEVEVKGSPFSASKYPVDQVNPVEGCFFDWIDKIYGMGLLRQGGISGKGKNLAEAQSMQRVFVNL